MRTYISGIITADNFIDAKERFGEAEEMLLSMGFYPVNPFQIFLSEYHLEKPEVMKLVLNRLINDCDSIYMLDAGTYAVRCDAEYKIAHCLGHKILNKDEEFQIKVKQYQKQKENGNGS